MTAMNDDKHQTTKEVRTEWTSTKLAARANRRAADRVEAFVALGEATEKLGAVLRQGGTQRIRQAASMIEMMADFIDVGRAPNGDD